MDKVKVCLKCASEKFNYNKETGVFTHKAGRRKGVLAGSHSKLGYTLLSVSDTEGNRRQIVAHRVAWYSVYGYEPGELDHINRDGFDNRIDNLREVSRSENCQNRSKFKNNSSGFRGVHKSRNGKWIARIQVEGKRRTVGIFDTAEEAGKEAENARNALHIDGTGKHKEEYFSILHAPSKKIIVPDHEKSEILGVSLHRRSGLWRHRKSGDRTKYFKLKSDAENYAISCHHVQSNQV